MPRPGPRRPLVAIRMSDEGIAYVDRWARKWEVNRSEAIRRMLAEWAKRNGEAK